MINLKQKLEKNDILNLFVGTGEHKIGVEYERLPILNSKLSAADYDETVYNFLRDFAKTENWDYITDDYNIIGLKQEHNTITLEPGSQIELSIEPQKTIFELENKIKTLNASMAPILKKYGITLLNYGVSPLSTHRNINLIPKERYKIMAKYLWGILSDVMMRETAGIQGTFDFKNEEDAAKKFKIANKLSPFMTAIFANSPIRGGVETGYKSFRGLSWLNTDNDRCGFACNLNKDFSFNEYIENVINSPMIFIKKDNKNIKINGKISFAEYMANGFEGFEANIEDFLLHSNLYFPEVRLRNFIEIRNHDCNHMPYSVLAVYKGILYSENSLNEIEELLKPYSHQDFADLRYNVPKTALQSKIKNHEIKNIAQEILKIAHKSLASTGEDKYLEDIMELTNQGLTPADIIIRNWNGIWHKDIRKLIKYLNSLAN